MKKEKAAVPEPENTQIRINKWCAQKCGPLEVQLFHGPHHHYTIINHYTRTVNHHLKDELSGHPELIVTHSPRRRSLRLVYFFTSRMP